jgi:hemolysin activation/secretion protein
LSSGRDLQYGRLSYDTLVSGAGTHVGASYSELHYVLGANLAALGGHGTAEVGSAWLRQVVERGTTLDVYAQLQFDHKRLQDDLDASEIHNDRHLNNWSASIAGDRRDGAIAGGVSTWSLGVTSGQLGFDNTRAAVADAYSARTAGRFLQGDVTLARLQGLAPRDAVYIALSGQWSNVNLDPSQKLTAGGAQTVRSYDTNSATGDAALQATGEWRHDLAAAFHGRWQTTAFVDLERLRLNRSVWTAGPNNATLGGVGAALSWSGAQQWSAKGSIAVRVGAPPPIVGDASETRAWLEVNKRF